MAKKRVLAKRGAGPKPMREKLAVAKKIPLEKKAPRSGQLAASASGRVVSYEVARITCRRVVHELADLADEKTKASLFLAALDNAIRESSYDEIGHTDLNTLRSRTAAILQHIEQAIRDLLAGLDL